MATNPEFLKALFAAFPVTEPIITAEEAAQVVLPDWLQEDELAAPSMPSGTADADDAPPLAMPDLSATQDSADFTPVPLQRVRGRGWTPLRQRHFIAALQATGSVGSAARAVGMGRQSAYRLRERAGAASFAAAWDRAMMSGQVYQYTMAMDRAIEGVTTIRIRRGGSIDIGAGADMKLINAVLREKPPRPHP